MAASYSTATRPCVERGRNLVITQGSFYTVGRYTLDYKNELSGCDITFSTQQGWYCLVKCLLCSLTLLLPCHLDSSACLSERPLDYTWLIEMRDN